MTGSTTLGASVNSSDPSKVSVSPSSISFDSCGAVRDLTVNALAETTSPITVSLSQTSNSTGGSFNLAPATFTVTVAAAPVIDPCLSVSAPAAPAFVTDSGDADGLMGWFVTVPTVSASSSTANSTITYSVDGGATFSATAPLLGQGTTTVTARATTATCNKTADTSTTFKVDTVAPSVTPGNVTTSGWNNTTVSQLFESEDVTSGLQTADDASFELEVSAESASASAPTTVSYDIYDVAGNKTTRTLSALIDKTNPLISADLDIAAGGSGWYNNTTGAPTVAFTCSDALSGLLADACPADYTFGEGADQEKSGTVYDIAGNSASDGVTNIDVDLTDPTIDASLDKSANAAGWFNAAIGAPTVSFDCADALSGLAGTCPADHTFGEGADQQWYQTVYDVAGNSKAGRRFEHRRGPTAPSVAYTSASGTLGANGWYTSSVVATFTGSDSTSGFGAAGASTMTDTTTSSGEGLAVSVDSPAFTDNAGNTTAAGSASEAFKIDLTKPTDVAFVGGPAAGSSHVFGSVPAAPTCTAEDAVSGLASCTVTGYLTTVGGHTMTATATDNAGHTETLTRTYTVLAWTMSGFNQPVDMNSVVNMVKGGSTVPRSSSFSPGARSSPRRRASFRSRLDRSRAVSSTARRRMTSSSTRPAARACAMTAPAVSSSRTGRPPGQPGSVTR